MTARMRAHAYFNHGRWVVDCPREFCQSAACVWHPEREDKWPRTSEFHCVNCKLMAPVAWPAEWREITAVLRQRPVPQTQNWFYANHNVAVQGGLPHGQTVSDLVEENREYGVGVPS